MPIKEMDRYLFHEGTHECAYDFLGAHKEDGGVRFTTWAPRAHSVAVVGLFNDWNGEHHQMQKISPEGIWSIFIDGLDKYTLYKYEIESTHYGKILKADPFAFCAEVRPKTASLVYYDEIDIFNDDDWMFERSQGNILEKPISIYEINLTSWRKNGDCFLTYRQLANELIPYLKAHHFTHVEIMPIMEHPFDGSWGYQITGFYAVTSRYGSPEDFKFLINELHNAGIGVILDWVPGHFCKDEHGLIYYDGEPLFEPADVNLRDNSEWGTMNFDYSRPEVRSFLISNALYWLNEFHVDGLRVDAVAYMLYKNMATGRYDVFSDTDYNEDAIAFIKQLNKAVFKHYPNVLMMAEESSSYPLVTGPVHDGGLGFNYKWNMGWMHDTLKYFKEDTLSRAYHQDKLTFSIYYAFNEKFVLPLSHDEVVHGKHSLVDKMPGDYWQKFANLRALIAYQYLHPGKKLNFMGNEFAQFIEWNEWQALDWFLMEYDSHKKFNDFFKAISALYVTHSELYEVEHHHSGFTWIEFGNTKESIIAFKRQNSKSQELLCIFNFTPIVRENYYIEVQKKRRYREIFNSDDTAFYGSGVINKGDIDAFEFKDKRVISLKLPPLGVIVLKPIATLSKLVRKE